MFVVPGVSLATLQEKVTSFRAIQPILERVNVASAGLWECLHARIEHESFVLGSNKS